MFGAETSVFVQFTPICKIAKFVIEMLASFVCNVFIVVLNTTNTLGKITKYCYNEDTNVLQWVQSHAISATGYESTQAYTYDAWGIEPDRREAEAREGADCAAVGRSQGAPTTQAAVGSPQTEYPLTITGTKAETLGKLNPLRYRGYVYDQETGLYYLQSRYYDPEMGRFLNVDSFAATGQGLLGNNMFAYCGNNPVCRSDPFGTCYIGINGGWYHDNWEYIGGYERKPDPRITNTSVSDEGLQFIADYEVYYSEPYDDGFGNMTIGYGHVIESGEVFSYLSIEEAKDLLKKDLQYWENEVAKYSAECAIKWDQNQFDAFVSLAFNSGYHFEEVMDLIIAGEDPYTAFNSIIYAGGSPVLGLYRRRMDEADMFVLCIYKRTYRGWQ